MSERAYLTPPQIASELGVQVGKILGWIARGELRAVNLAERANGKRPRWKISRQALDDFLAARTPTPPQTNKRRTKRRGSYEFEYYG